MPQARHRGVDGSRVPWSDGFDRIATRGQGFKPIRRAPTYYDNVQLQLRLGFTADYSGRLRFHSVDLDTTSRGQIVKVDDGSDSQQTVLDSPFNMGAWMHFPIPRNVRCLRNHHHRPDGEELGQPDNSGDVYSDVAGLFRSARRWSSHDSARLVIWPTSEACFWGVAVDSMVE